jgi:hypothetical protein
MALIGFLLFVVFAVGAALLVIGGLVFTFTDATSLARRIGYWIAATGCGVAIMAVLALTYIVVFVPPHSL